MRISHTKIPDVIILEPEVDSDNRGFFMETYQRIQLKEFGIKDAFVQDNHSGSKQGVLRGLHYQISHAQGKLVRVIVGEVFDVAVDLRRNLETFGQWAGVCLSAENKNMMWVPPGFAHGFYTMSKWAEVIYKVTDYYVPEWERTLQWNDSSIGIEWPLINGQSPILSAKDADGVAFEEVETYP